jgi:hypothetical protein
MQSKDLLNQMLLRSLSGAALLLLSPTLPAKVHAFMPRLDAKLPLIHATSPAGVASLSSTPHNTVPKQAKDHSRHLLMEMRRTSST